MPACQTINVVMSPKGLKAPPAFAAITMFIHPIEINFVFEFLVCVCVCVFYRKGSFVYLYTKGTF